MTDGTERDNDRLSDESLRRALEIRVAELEKLVFFYADTLGLSDFRTLWSLRLCERMMRVCDVLPRIPDERVRFSLAVESADFLDYADPFLRGLKPGCFNGSALARFLARIRTKQAVKEYRYRTRSFFRSADLILAVFFPPLCDLSGDSPRRKPPRVEDFLFSPGPQPFDLECETMKAILKRQAEAGGKPDTPGTELQPEERPGEDVADIL